MAGFEDLLDDAFIGGDETFDDDMEAENVAGAVPQGRARKAYQFYIDKGMTPAAAAGIVGNLMQESGPGLNPTLIHDGGIGVGIAGWNGPRRIALRALAAKRGVGETDYDTQLEHSWNELNGPERATLARLNGVSDPSQAARIALGYFRPSDPATPNRIRNAVSIFGGDNPATGVDAPVYSGGRNRRGRYRNESIAEDNATGDGIPLGDYGETGTDADPVLIPEISNDELPEDLERPAIISRPIIQQDRVAPNPNVAKQGLAKGAAAVANTPWSILQLLPLLTGRRGGEFWNAIQQSKDTTERTMDSAFGVEEPQGTEEQVAAALGKGVTVGPQAVPMSLLGGGFNLISDAMADTKQAREARKTAKQLEIDKELSKRIEFVRAGLPTTGNMTAFIPQEREMLNARKWSLNSDGKDIPVETINIGGKYYNVPSHGDSNMSAIQHANEFGLDKFPNYPDERQAKIALDRMNAFLKPDIDRTKIALPNMGGGQTTVNMGDLMKYGGTAAAVTAGAIMLPWLTRKVLPDRIPSLRVRDVSHTPGEVGAISTAGNYARTTIDDVNAGVLDIARRAGVGGATFDQIMKTFNIQTRGAAQMLADSAVVKGVMDSMSYKFNVRRSAGELNKVDNPIVTKYMETLDTMDQFLATQTKNLMQPRSKPAPTTIRGMTEPQVMQQIKDMEAAYPQLELPKIAASYQDVVKSTRKLLSTSEYAIMRKGDAARLNATNSNYIHDIKGRMGELGETGSATHSLMGWQRTVIRQQFENEARGLYIDAIKNIDLGNGKRLAVQLSKEEMKNNPHWAKNTVTVYRRGEKEVYATDPFIADMMKMDPYYTASNGPLAILAMPKRLFEATTTGVLAPWFAVTSFSRNNKLVATSVPDTMKSAWFPQRIAAIPQQLMPQLAGSIAESLERGGGGWIRSMFGNDVADGMSKRLAQMHDKSFYAQLEAAGTHYGDFAQQQVAAHKLLNQAIKTMEPTTAQFFTAVSRNLYSAYNASLQSLHNAGAFAAARRSRGNFKNMAELAYETRRLTGNPQAGGQMITQTANGIRPFAFDTSRMNMGEKLDVATARFAGGAAEFGRQFVPWTNPTMQGMKRVGQAYLDNPAKWVGRQWLYGQMPAASAYLWNASLGNDPNGRPYTDYDMNGRTPYSMLMQNYYAWPGRPAEEGITTANVHEYSLGALFLRTALHHLHGGSIFPMSEDLLAAAKSFGGVLDPPSPTFLSVGLGTKGMVANQGVFGSDQPYSPKEQAFNQHSTGLPTWIETTIRALGGGTADVAIKAYLAGAGSEGILDGAKNAMSAAGKAAASKAPYIRNLFDATPPMSGNVRVMNEYYDKKKELDRLFSYYTKWDASTKTHGPGELDTFGRSKTGSAITEAMPLLGPENIKSIAGPSPPEPTNPLYTQFIDELNSTFKKDSTNVGGLGFLSAGKALQRATIQAREMRNVDSGNLQAWIRDTEKNKPDVIEELKRFGVNPHDSRAVQTFFAQRQQNAAQTLLFMVRTVESDLSKRIGRPVRIKDLEPYLTDQDTDRPAAETQIVPDVQQ